ncbi:MAG: zinc ribbon domain-containing protein [Planctomycetota bacterium]|jgi:hypothetical protein
MNCPKCGTQNPEDAQLCNSCGSDLTQPHTTGESVKVKTSRLAIAAFVFAILTLFLLPFALPLRGNPIVGIWLIATILAIVLGIIALIEIGLSAGKVAGKAFAAMAVAIPVVFYFVMCFLAVLTRPRSIAFKMVCGSNLSGIGRAMLIYANDYDNSFPRAGGPTTKWGTTPDWQAENRIDAFGLKPDGTGGSATISSNLYLLVKYVEVTPKSFCCKDDIKTKPFKASDYGALMYDEDAWDFGPNPTKHCSYSYHMPYGPYPLSTSTSEPGVAVAADRNPWIDSPFSNAKDFRTFDPTGIRAAQKAGNAIAHKSEGQNVLFMDNHVYFEKQSFCGVDDDNIYTYWNGSDIQQGAPPTLTSQPADRLDSLLVNDPPKRDQK